MSDVAAGRSPTRVAVIAVPGVGDERPGDTVESLAGALLAAKGGTAAEADRVLVPVGPERSRHAVERRRLRRSDGVQLDLYEMAWADLSRFPAGLWAFLGTAVGLALQMTTIGLEAVRPLEARPELARTRGALATALGLGNLASWCLATLALGSLVLAGGLALALWAAVGLAGTPWLALSALAALVGLLAVGGVAIAGRRGGWPATVPVLAALTAATAAAAIILVSDEGAAVGLANALLGVVAYPLRLAWLATLAAIAATVVALAMVWWRAPGARRGAVSALATFALAPLMIALIAGGATAGVGAIALTSLERTGWGEQVTSLRCLSSSASWDLQRCGSGDREARRNVQLAGRLHRLADEGEQRAAELATVDPARSAAISQEAELVSSQARAAERAAGIGPSGWARTLFAQIAGAMLAGVILALASLVGAAAALGPHIGARVRSALGRSEPESRRRERLARVGATLGTGLRRLDGPVAATTLAVAAVVGALWALLWWTVVDIDLLPGPWAAGAAILIAAILVLMRAFPLDPRRPADSVGGGLAHLRRLLDLPYDIAGYLRLSGDGRRGRRADILSRYRAVLRAVTETVHEDGSHGYDAVLLVAHSQGSLLTATVLYGDPARQAPEPSLAEADPATAAALAASGVSMLTFGSPIAQLYDHRLPGQYGRLRDLPDLPAHELLPLTGEWLNAYRPGDFVGRAIWADPLDPDSSRPGAEAFSSRVPEGPRFRDLCLALPGGHAGYWSDPVVARHLSEIAGRLSWPRRGAGAPSEAPRRPLTPPGHAPLA